MFYPRHRIAEPLVYGLIGTGHKNEREEQVRTCPSILTGTETLTALGDSLDIGKYTKSQPCSLDILIEQFSDSKGKPLAFPFVVRPNEDVIGHTDISYRPLEKWDVLCVETRSRQAARRGFTCLGFINPMELSYRDSFGDHTNPTPFLERSASLSFAFRNYLPFPIRISAPFSPVQISITREIPEFDYLRLKGFHDVPTLTKDGKDITREARVRVDNFWAYTVHCAEELWYFDASHDVIDLTAVDQVVKKAHIAQIHEINPKFCLTVTQEDVDTDGCPVHLFPFHYLDIKNNLSIFRDNDRIASFFAQVFSETRYLPITANAGVHNPGCKGKIVFENITDGRDLAKYMNTTSPFGILIPVPFYDGQRDRTGYTGDGYQRGISL